MRILSDEVTITARGFVLSRHGETVPFGEELRSIDGLYWRCHRPDGSRRCFFAPPGST